MAPKIAHGGVQGWRDLQKLVEQRVPVQVDFFHFSEVFKVLQSDFGDQISSEIKARDGFGILYFGRDSCELVIG